MKIYVYLIYFPTSKRLNPHYIGITNNLNRRLVNQHLNSKYLVGNALQKYNDWIIKKLHTCKTYKEAFKIEIEEIRNFNSVAPNGYNLTRGGDGVMAGMKHSKETRKKMSDSAKGNKNSQGYRHTKETLEKMQGNQNAKGFKHPKEFGNKISVRMQGNQNATGKRSEEFCERCKGNKHALKHDKYIKEVKPTEGK